VLRQPDTFHPPSRRNVKPIEPLRLGCSAEVGQGQERPDAGYRSALVDPVGRVHRTAKLQLIGLGCDGDDVEDYIRSREFEIGYLIYRVGRRT
jgi:hypothetical protein